METTKDTPETTPCFFDPSRGTIYSVAQRKHRNSARTNEIRIPRKMAAREAIPSFPTGKGLLRVLDVHGHAIPFIYLFWNNNGPAHPEYANCVERSEPFNWLLLTDFDKQNWTVHTVYARHCNTDDNNKSQLNMESK